MDTIFRKLLGFDNRRKTDPKTRAKYLLFFVTKYASLRDDMEPGVVRERLYDWGYNDLTEDQIRESFEADPDIRPSRQREGTYEVTRAAELSIRRKLRFRSIPFTSPANLVLISAGVGVLLLLLAIVAYSLTSSGPVSGWGADEFLARVGFFEPQTSNAERAKYYLFFVTEVAGLRFDMAPDILAERLLDKGVADVSSQGILEGLLADPEILESSERSGAFVIAPEAVARIADLVHLRKPEEGVLTLGWLSRHISVTGWLTILGYLVGIIGGCFSLGFVLGKLQGQHQEQETGR